MVGALEASSAEVGAALRDLSLRASASLVGTVERPRVRRAPVVRTVTPRARAQGPFAA